MENFRTIFSLLTPRERWQAALIFAFMLPNALMQVAGIASVMPFIAVLAQPELVESNAVIAKVHLIFGEPPVPRFLALLAGMALALLVGSNALYATTTWLILRFSYMRINTLSQRLLNLYLHQDYSFFLSRNPADLAKNILAEVNQLVSGFLMPLLQLASSAIVITAILVLLVLAEPRVALSVGLALGGAYGLVYAIFRGRLRTLGARRLEANRRRFRAAHETFGAIKDLKVSGRERYYLDRYQRASYAFASTQSKVQLIAQLPRYALESIAFGIVLVVALYLALSADGASGALPMIALYAMAGHRLMPALQKLFDSAAILRNSAPVVERISQEFKEGRDIAEYAEGVAKPEGSQDLRLEDGLELKGIVYRYEGMSDPVLKGINLRIDAHTTVAFVGASGAGKSTLVDIILGLLRPECGEILIDGVPLVGTRRLEWRRHVGYVPQAIYLADDTVRQNIALGIPARDIDDEAVIAAAKAAAIHDFIVNDLPAGYDTVTGDRGVRLSGGQRQRIGIARALYSNPDLLILDEATSALDGSTEAAVMDAIERLSGDKTIIMVAHRLTTVRNCNRLFFLGNGRLIASGTYDELLTNEPEFRRMAIAASALGGQSKIAG